MVVLAMDTCLGACSAAVVDRGALLGARSEPMMRGHQERIAPIVDELMEQLKLGFSAIDRIGVTVGPGSFTGLRVGIAFAKGLALSLHRHCAGVGTLEALAATAKLTGPVAAVVDAGRGNVYLQVFVAGRSVKPADVLGLDHAAEWLAGRGDLENLSIVGPGARLLEARLHACRFVDLNAPSPQSVARLAWRARVGPMMPLYLRSPGAVQRP